MKVLITGATGFIGSDLKSYLIENGHVVHYLTNNSKKIIQKKNEKGFLWDTKSKTIDALAFEGVDVIINLAGKTINCPWTEKNKKEILSSRISSSQILYDFLSKHPHNVKQIIHAAAIGIYPSSINREYTEEETHVNPEFLGTVCKAWEEENRKFSNLHLINTFVRIGLVLSKDKGALPEITNLVKKGIGKSMGSGKQIYSWIHKQDLIRMVYFLAQNGIDGVYNAVSDNPITQKELNESIAKQLQKKFWFSNIPESLFKIALGERSALILDSTKVDNSKIKSKGFQFDFQTIDEALENIYK